MIARRIKIELNANHIQLESLGILFDGTHRTGGERQLIFTPITEDNKPPYELKPGKLFEIADATIDDINDVMTSSTDMGEKSKSVVTASLNDITNENCPLPKVMSLMSQTSPLSQTVRIDANDPISFLAKVMEHNLSASGINVTPFEEFCRREEEKTRNKNKEQREFIDVKFSEETKTVEDNSDDYKNDFVLSGKNKIDVTVKFLKAFLLKARLNCA